MPVTIKTEMGLTHTTITAPPKPNLKDFYLSGIDLQCADNGVIIECRYRLKPEVDKARRAKSSKSSAKEPYGDYESRYPNEKHVFESMEDAADFIQGRLLGKEAK